LCPSQDKARSRLGRSLFRLGRRCWRSCRRAPPWANSDRNTTHQWPAPRPPRRLKCYMVHRLGLLKPCLNEVLRTRASLAKLGLVAIAYTSQELHHSGAKFSPSPMSEVSAYPILSAPGFGMCSTRESKARSSSALPDELGADVRRRKAPKKTEEVIYPTVGQTEASAVTASVFVPGLRYFDRTLTRYRLSYP
jgi:hypothetical protein